MCDHPLSMNMCLSSLDQDGAGSELGSCLEARGDVFSLEGISDNTFAAQATAVVTAHVPLYLQRQQRRDTKASVILENPSDKIAREETGASLVPRTERAVRRELIPFV